MGFQMSEFEFQTYLFFVWPPPPMGKKAEIFPFFNYDASPYSVVPTSGYMKEMVNRM